MVAKTGPKVKLTAIAAAAADVGRHVSMSDSARLRSLVRRYDLGAHSVVVTRTRAADHVRLHGTLRWLGRKPYDLTADLSIEGRRLQVRGVVLEPFCVDYEEPSPHGPNLTDAQLKAMLGRQRTRYVRKETGDMFDFFGIWKSIGRLNGFGEVEVRFTRSSIVSGGTTSGEPGRPGSYLFELPSGRYVPRPRSRYDEELGLPPRTAAAPSEPVRFSADRFSFGRGLGGFGGADS